MIATYNTRSDPSGHREEIQNMGLQEDFDAAAKDAAEGVGNMPKITQDQKLELYALFKQSNVGDVQGDRPGMLDFTGKAKYDAWAKLKGMSQDDAKQKYISNVNTWKA